MLDKGSKRNLTDQADAQMRQDTGFILDFDILIIRWFARFSIYPTDMEWREPLGSLRSKCLMKPISP